MTVISELVAGTVAQGESLATHQAVVYEQAPGGTAWTFQRGAAEISVIVDGRVRMSAAEGVRAGCLLAWALRSPPSGCLTN
jgi:uncharacterized cupin superfamily protein